MSIEKICEIIIASNTPYFLERGALWFSENELKIKKASKMLSWWKNNILVLEKDQKANLWEILRKIQESNYEKVQTIGNTGEFAHRGNIVDIAPINSEKAFRLEFYGNYLKEIRVLDVILTLRKKKNKKDEEESLKNLKPGDYIVHLDHGIGIFREIRTTSEPKLYVIEYAKNDTLIVPESVKHKLSPYVGFSSPIVHRLGGTLWHKTKRKVADDAIKTAKDLLEIYAQREIAKGFAFSQADEMQNELASSFPYIETADQERAIREVESDMESEQIMDRLVCGDVGFGKTEVAVRAAFKATSSGKQTVILCPTTILCDQHFKTFRERLGRLPVRIATLSRLVPKDEQATIIEKTKNGEIDILISTHRVLSRDIGFKDLGLVIIDEEQRFGVKQKEKLKALKSSVDTLSLSATPIPRTLHFSLSGLKGISIINTPPPGRLPIKTKIGKYRKDVVKEAIEFELDRNGQVYFLHDRVATMGIVKRHLNRLVPRAKIGIIHGKLSEKELMDVIEKLKNKEINILLATTIIENGIDFPNVNTLIVANATRLGLSQAHQIRGRIGRSEKEAFAYFLYRTKNLTKPGKARLRALKEAESLGDGYKLAIRDLEIRGAGNILGREQSGSIAQVGLNLYCQMLAEAVEKMKNP